VLYNLCSQALLTQFIMDVFSIKEFLARGASFCGNHSVAVLIGLLIPSLGHQKL
jgi:hypothetical protein